MAASEPNKDVCCRRSQQGLMATRRSLPTSAFRGELQWRKLTAPEVQFAPLSAETRRACSSIFSLAHSFAGATGQDTVMIRINELSLPLDHSADALRQAIIKRLNIGD